MSVQHSRIIVLVVGGAVFASALMSVLWSVVPIGGETLPHMIDAHSELSFRVSALLVSLVAGVLGVIAMFVFACYPQTYPSE